jgi:hypothetical protein
MASLCRRFVGSALGAALAAFVTGAAPAAASTGAGVAANPVSLAGLAVAGRSYELPGLYVVNTGTDPATYHVQVERLSSATGRDIPSAWVRFGQNDFPLRPGKSAIVPIEVTIPSGAPAGSYGSDLVASASAGDAGGTTLGAAAATGLSFTVGAGGGFRWPKSSWPYLGLLGIGLLGTAVFAQRRLGLHLRLERR